ncbi:MAG: endonuclease domain-containing protein [Bacteroidota bacterium]
MDENDFYYNPKLKPLARANRNQLTQAEIRLWKQILRGGQMHGYTFNRQRPVLDYIADFMCKPSWLIIEVDGVTHQEEEQWKSDQSRQADLEEKGFTVLRFSDDEIMNKLEDVVLGIEEMVLRLEQKLGDGGEF